MIDNDHTGLNQKKRKVISDSAVLSIVEVLIRLKGIIFLPVIIATIGLDHYGVFVQILVNQFLILSFCTLALGMAFFRYTSQFEDHDVYNLSVDFWTVISISAILSLIGAVVIYVLSPIISEQILDCLCLSSLRLSSALVIIGVFGEQLSRYIQSRRRFKLFGLYNIAYQLGPYLGFCIALLIKPDLFFGLQFYIGVQFVAVISLFIIVLRTIRFCLPSLSRLIKFIRYSWGLMFSWISGGLLSKINRYFIGYFLNPAAIGIYNIIYAVASFLDMYTVPFRKYFDVYLPKEWDSGHITKVKGQLKEGLLYYLIISVGTLVGLTLYLKPTIFFLLQKDVSYIPNFELLVFFIGIGLLCLGISRFYDPIIKFKEVNHLKLGILVVAVIVNAGLNYFFIPLYGLLGAAISTFFAYLIVLSFLGVLFRLNLKPVFFIKVTGMMIATIPIYVLYRLVEVRDILSLVLCITMGITFFLLIILFLRVINIKRLKSFFV